MATIQELEHRIDALEETLHHIIEALEGGNFSEPTPNKPLDFSSIPGHVQHS
ncbi:MAG TPA: hypothetical protein VL913_00725 [Candidatus Micrarchaeaceae archaeon]|nr:hypothetical protein [Candidatus Micrarchaeaceae archaeon]